MPRSSATNSAPPDAERSDSVWRVYHELRGVMVSGELAPGARIAERTIADRLGVSRTPVRSALHWLQLEGFVDSSGGGRDRLVVAPLTQEDGREIMLIIGHLEGLAAHSAAELPREARRVVVNRLRRLNSELAVAARKRAPVARLFELDQAFHNAYVEDVSGPRHRALHRAIKPQVERYARLYISSPANELPTSVHEHELIVRAIARGDAAAAQAAVENNWHNAADRLARVIARYDELGVWQRRDANGPGGKPSPRRRKKAV